MSLTPEELDQLAKKLRLAKDIPLTIEEQKAVREMLVAWEIWKSFGRVGKILIWLLMSLAGFILAWQQVREGFGKWFNV
jgi:hypothetical protein